MVFRWAFVGVLIHRCFGPCDETTSNNVRFHVSRRLFLLAQAGYESRIPISARRSFSVPRGFEFSEVSDSMMECAFE